MKHNRFITWIITSSLFLVFLGRLQIVLTRYFDADEFAHLHWTYLLSLGNLPYRDMFIFHIPVFQWFLRPIFLIPFDSSLLILARLGMFMIYLWVAVLLFIMTKYVTKNLHMGLFAILLFFVFPMTFDKSIEVRPDMLMMFFFLLSIVFLIYTPKRSLYVLSGLFYGISILIFPKIFFAFPCIIYLLVTLSRTKTSSRALVYWIAGFIFPLLMFLWYLVSYNIVPDAITAFTKTAVIVYSGKPRFSPLVALSPFPLVYIERSGVSLPWLVNILIFVSSIFGFYTLAARNKRFAVLSLLYLVFGGIFLFLFPSPYTQYFVPFSVILSTLAGVFIVRIIYWIHSAFGKNILSILIAGFLLVSFWQQYAMRVNPKASNLEQIQAVADVLRISKPNETFYDVVGSYVFRPDGYVICCHPYGEFINRMNPKPMSLRESLINNQTKFLIMDRTGLLFWLTPKPDLGFLESNYLPSSYRKIYTAGQQFSCKKGICTQQSAEGKPLSIKDTVFVVIPEQYRISIQPASQRISLGQHTYRNGDTAFLKAQSYKITVPASVAGFSVQLDR